MRVLFASERTPNAGGTGLTVAILMTSSDNTRTRATGSTCVVEQDDRVDAIRYIVLRKLAPGLRHALMGELQAIQLSAEFASRALQAGTDTGEMRDSVARIPQLCADAVKAGRLLAEWLRPEQGAAITVGEGVEQCLKLAGEDWFLRGIEATTDLPERDVLVPKAVLLELVVTGLLVLSDMHEQPVDLHVAVRLAADHIDVVLQARVADRIASIPTVAPYRKLVWADLKLMASANGVACACEGDTASLQIKRLSPAR